MSTAEVFIPTPLLFTDNAVSKVRALIDEEGNELEGSRFVINNPNAATTCGCGSSFSV